ncbi:MAG: AMP-binding protein [Gammaproteobacteria bacterium]|nr:AMP-binding protein [Gammaproteobacteria bacterium]
MLEPRGEQTLAQVLHKRVQRCGDKAWLVSGENSYTYREIDALSNRLARGITAAGLKPGQTLLLMLPDVAQFIVTWCAVAKLGVIEVPVNTHLKGSVLTHVINDSRATTMIIDRQFLDRIEAVAHKLEYLRTLILFSESAAIAEGLPGGIVSQFKIVQYDDLLSHSDAAIKAAPRYNDLMAVMYTSGTTGASKGVMITQVHAYEYARSAIELLELKDSDVYYAPLPLFHIAGQWAVIYACCIVGATAVLSGRFSLEQFWRDVERYGATCSFLLGAMANFLFRQPQSPSDANNTMERMLVVPLLPEIEAFKRRFDVSVSTTWGSTEVNVPTRSGFDLADNKTCGWVASDRYEVRIVDEDDNEVPHGVPGEAVVRSKEPWIMMSGYWNDPEATAKAWRNLWLHSGDMLMRDAEGNFYFVDRVKDAIRRRGENISSMEVEQEINGHSDVLECAVVPVHSEHTEQEVMVAIVPKEGRHIDPFELIDFLKPRMAYFMIPRYVEIVETLPKTQTGKIQKFQLRERGVTVHTWDREAAGVRLNKS